MTAATKSKLDQVLDIVVEIIADAEKTGLGGMPSGHLYASLMQSMSLDTYNSMLTLLKRDGRITESGYLLKTVK